MLGYESETVLPTVIITKGHILWDHGFDICLNVLREKQIVTTV